MTCTHSRRRRTIRRTSVALVGLMSLACAGKSAETKRMEAIAGTYVWDHETDPATDPGHMHLHEQHTLTLRPDGRWTATHLAEVDGQSQPVPPDSGTYHVQGATLTTSPTEEQPAMEYTISGDTLWIRAAAALAQGEAVTGVDIPQGSGESFLVRQQ